MYCAHIVAYIDLHTELLSYRHNESAQVYYWFNLLKVIKNLIDSTAWDWEKPDLTAANLLFPFVM